MRSFQLTTSRRGRQLISGAESTPGHYFNSLPHAEVDKIWKQVEAKGLEFQLTTSRRGRRDHEEGGHYQWYFNSLPHAEVDAQGMKVTADSIIFQLTTSRRGRLLPC